MSELMMFMNNHRDLIGNILDLFFISTHYYLLYNDYHLEKGRYGKQKFLFSFLIEISYWF